MNLDILPLPGWITSGPLIISGPCGAESEEQVLQTAHAIADIPGIKVFRAGIWKPRTRPNSFEGIGSPGLKWLSRVKTETGLLTTVEVANAKHAEEALGSGVDILWIGARTTVNPFSVQEIADVLRGTDVPVMVKNPVHPDLQLWIGAIERFASVGIRKLIAIHRGFHDYDKSKYRNTPHWEIPMELKTIFPELPVVCDPSHISGRTDIIPAVAQKALDLDMAGLMIETHINPKLALSDANQQLTPAELRKLVSALVFRKPDASNSEFKSTLEQLRSIIDDIDDEVVEALARRMNVAEKIGEYKKENNVTIFQVKRFEEILGRVLASGKASGLSEDFIRGLIRLVHKESIRRQREVMRRVDVSGVNGRK